MLPESLSNALEVVLKDRKTAGLVREGSALSGRYRFRKGSLPAQTPASALAYAVSRLPATYEAVRFALSCLPDSFCPSTLIDAGSGPGTAAWAASGHWPGLSSVLWEQDPEMIRLGLLLGAPGRYEAVDILHPPERSADLVIAAYVLNEIPEPLSSETVRILWERTEKALVLIDPGTPEAFRRMQGFRSLLLELGASIAAPCPHSRPCPLPEGDWCHFGCRVSRTRLHREIKGGARGFEDEKITFLIATREPEVCGSRIIRRPEFGKGIVRLSLCTKSGLQTLNIPKSEEPFYQQARHAVWGGLWKA